MTKEIKDFVEMIEDYYGAVFVDTIKDSHEYKALKASIDKPKTPEKLTLSEFVYAAFEGEHPDLYDLVEVISEYLEQD